MNRIVTISGADRVGKATSAKLLSEALGATLLSCPAYSSISGQIIRGILTGSNLHLSRYLYGEPDQPLFRSDGEVEMAPSVLEFEKIDEILTKDPLGFQCIQAWNRREIQPAIVEALSRGHVVMDRYDIDALVYGTVDGIADLAWIENLNKCLIPSDLVIIIDGPTFSRDEVADSNETDTTFQARVKELYRELAPKYGWHIVETAITPESWNLSEADAKKWSIERTHEKVMEVVRSYFQGLGDPNPEDYDMFALDRFLESLPKAS